ncbi:MAG: flagellar basal body P-ring formation protein FlgA [Deltaproteobacteria bacterium]|nr:flagellar basal body P-ring formation protein FlgA [Deltaproteobacteria bacterium]
MRPPAAGFRRTFAAVALVAVLVAASRRAAAESTGRIKVLPQATVAGATVRLADLAVLEGVGVDFADLEVCPAPEAGASRRISGQSVLTKLQGAGLAESVAYTIPASVSITRAHQVVDEAALRPAIETQLASQLAPGDRVDEVDVQRQVRIPLGAYDVEVDPPSTHATGGGFRRTDVRIVQDGVVTSTVPVRVKIATFGNVVVARQPIARGTILGEDDLRIEERRLDELPTTVLTDVASAIGREARVAIAAGKALTLQGLANAVLVKRGGLVRVLVERGGMRISVAGEAMETGGAGDRVRVVNASSKRELVGRVVDHGTVSVVY